MEVLGGGSLQIFNLTEEDAGVYTCMADNSNATIEAQAQLTVQGTLIYPHRPLSIVGLEVQSRVCNVSSLQGLKIMPANSARSTDDKLYIYSIYLPLI